VLSWCCCGSLLQVFDIGAGCDEPARKVAELPDYLQEVTRLSGGRQQVFGAGDDKRSTAIKYLAVVRECAVMRGRQAPDRCQAGSLHAARIHPAQLSLQALSNGGTVCVTVSVCVSLCLYVLLPVAMAESWKIHLVAVAANGRRAYFTTSPYMRGGYGEERDLAKV
jgi:hypothetical protein